jgi:hypothetical protein
MNQHTPDGEPKVQRCVKCDAPTGRCEDDSIFDGERGPLCEDCAPDGEHDEAGIGHGVDMYPINGRRCSKCNRLIGFDAFLVSRGHVWHVGCAPIRAYEQFDLVNKLLGRDYE